MELVVGKEPASKQNCQPLEYLKIQNLKMKETIKGISTIYLQTLAHSYLKLFMQNNVTLYFYRKYHRATRLTKFIQNITTNTLMLRKKKLK